MRDRNAARGRGRGIVKRRVLLGDTIDYRVQVGRAEVRVQRNVRKPVFNQGDRCNFRFGPLHRS